MAAKLAILSAAERDVDEAYGWYELRGPGVGEDFLRAVDARIEGILRNPTLCEVVYKDYRRAIVRRYPYVILYKYETETVTIYAVPHTSQHARKWKRRLP
jgi:plasmid stabilization system protein ParE